MPNTYITVDQTGSGPLVALANSDNIYIAQGVLYASTDDSTIYSTQSNHLISVAGHVIEGYPEFSGEAAINIAVGIGVDDYANTTLIVHRSGIVEGRNAIAIQGRAASVENYGEIYGENIGVDLGSTGGSTNRVYNGGTITSGRYGITTVDGNTDGLNIINAGLIAGEILGFSAFGGAGNTTIRNTGTIIGGVAFGSGNDRYDGRGGACEDVIYGGAGADTFVVGAGTEVLIGGPGTDALDFRLTNGIRVYLDGSAPNSGTAAGDTYAQIDLVIGSAIGADRLVGNGAANTLRGLGGADVLSGGAGADTLRGGLGVDTMTGGTGADAFDYTAVADGGDNIRDFGVTDVIRIEGSAFGLGAASGGLAASRFTSGVTNAAGDANDRFIFRTTDRTLWHDANGNAAGGLTLLADLQAGAVLNAGDFLLV